MSEAPSARAVALSLLRRIESDGAYANLVLRTELARSGLADMDRRFVTELVNGTTRMRRACDALLAPYVLREPTPDVRTLLRLGAYQLAVAGVPSHAAVSETVALATPRTRGFVNAVLRRVAASHASFTWPDDATRLSYPDWIVERLRSDLGGADAMAALERMNQAPPVTRRDDGYVQDLASQWVARLVDARPGHRVLDLCAGPGGKATALAATGASVVAADLYPHRAGLVRSNAASLGHVIPVVTADGTRPPLREASFDRVLVDAPCSGLGALRRRADARWRIRPADVDDLVALQARLLTAAALLVAPGGVLVYSVCTLTAAESVDHAIPDGFEPDTIPPPSALTGPWSTWSHGLRLLPQDADTDGMVVVRLRRRS